MKRRFLVIFICIAVVCSGCASTSMQQTALPASHGPLEHDKEVMEKLQKAVKSLPALIRVGQFTIPELRVLARATRQEPAAILKCDLQVLRAFIASNWVPIVILGTRVGPKHVVAVVGYDNAAEQLIIVDARSYAQTRVKYPAFFKRWIGPQKTCLLMFSRYVGDNAIKAALRDYLPEERAESIVIRTAREKL